MNKPGFSSQFCLMSLVLIIWLHLTDLGSFLFSGIADNWPCEIPFLMYLVVYQLPFPLSTQKLWFFPLQ